MKAITKPKPAAFPKCLVDKLCIDPTMTVIQSIDLAAKDFL